MRGYLLLLCSSLYIGAVQAQSEQQAIQQWQSLHPTTFLISSERFSQLTEEERAVLGENYIVFQDKITLEQLQQFDAKNEKSLAVSPKHPIGKDEDVQLVKNWMSQHRNVKVIPHSKYITLSEVRLQQVQTPEYIVLEGESITLKDVEAYKALYDE